MADKEEKDKIFNQIKYYLLSSIQTIKIFDNDRIDCNWIEDELYIISSEFINKWKSLIHYNEIYNELKKNNISDKIDVNSCFKDIIINKIENLKVNSNIMKNKSFAEFNYSISNSLKDSLDSQKSINPNMDFELITKKCYESFIEKENNKHLGKISIKKGIKKIIIKASERIYIILYIKKQNENNINKEIKPFEQELIKLIIEIINEPNIDLINNFIDEIIKVNISNWLDEIKYNNLENKKQHSYKGINFFICKKREPMFSINQSYINTNESQISKSSTISLIREINYINTVIVTKIKNSSYIIASMYSLSQITEFAQYFYAKNINFNKCSKLLIFSKNL
jgi:hypothetical protein